MKERSTSISPRKPFLGNETVMDDQYAWISFLKIEHGKGIPSAIRARGHCVVRKKLSEQISCHCPFNIDAVANEIAPRKPNEANEDKSDLRSFSGPSRWLCLDDSAVFQNVDSDDEDSAHENRSNKVGFPEILRRIEPMAKKLCSDNVSVRVQTLVELQEAIEYLFQNISPAAELKFPPLHDIGIITMNRTLPLISDYEVPKQLENKNVTGVATKKSCRTKPNNDKMTARFQIILNTCGNALFRLIGDSRSEKCRGLSMSCVQLLLLSGIDVDRHVPFLIPALCSRYPPSSYDKDMEVFIKDTQSHDFFKRGGAIERQDRCRMSKLVEPSEELRIELCRTFSCLLRGILATESERTLDRYYPDIIFSLQSSLSDPCPEIKIEACKILVQLLRIPHWHQGAKYFATGLARSVLPIFRHRNSNVIIAALELFEASVCTPDKAKMKGAGTTAIADLVGFQAENILPIAAFYDSKFNVTVNVLADLATHKNHRVRLRCCEMISNFLVHLPDRFDHQPRLLPYMLSFISSDLPDIQRTALDCIERCGLQYECEHPDDVIERRQFGIDGDESIDYDSDLPAPFIRRPNLGARLFVRANTLRYYSALLNELSNWRDQTRKRSAELLLILTVYCEEHLTRDIHQTIASISKAISTERSKKDENDQLMILAILHQVLRLMAKYIDPASYLPLLFPRIVGDCSSATSNSEDGCHSERSRSTHAVILKSLIDGAPLRLLLLHWNSLASLLTSKDCIGPYAGTQTKHDCLSAYYSLICKVLCEGNYVVKDYVCYFANNEAALVDLHSILSLSDVALVELMSRQPNDEDSKLARMCIEGQSKIIDETNGYLPNKIL